MPGNPEKPPWLRIRAPTDPRFAEIRALIGERGLNTVCTASRCPNMGECWSSGHATFMILGGTCTRHCRFCSVPSGEGEELDPDEGAKIADVVDEIGLRHVVITSVTRDDLDDGGAGHFASVVHDIRKRCKDVTVELLIPDLMGDEVDLDTIIDSHPDVIGHNLETVRRMHPDVRDPRSSYDLSLGVLRHLGEMDETILTKSSLMLGLGETEEEVLDTMGDLLESGVELLTLGQYIQPLGSGLMVQEYVHPYRFDRFREIGLEMGFRHVASGPFVRSSYRAGEALESL